jgi:1-acyl-sn-glycerol-3-phosphate acyltransferase
MIALLRLLARVLFRPIVEGRENLPPAGPVIIAANHLSFFDSIIIPLVARRPISFLAKAEYFTGRGIRGRLRRAFFVTIEAVPVERGGHRAAQAALEAAADVLAEGRAFGIYPEGTRSRDGRLYRGRTGVAWLALTSGAPVVPVAVAGTDRIQPIGARLPRIRRVRLRFGPALRFGPSAGDPIPAGRRRREITDEVMSAIQRLSDQEPAGCYAPIPPEASGIDKY